MKIKYFLLVIGILCFIGVILYTEKNEFEKAHFRLLAAAIFLSGYCITEAIEKLTETINNKK